MEQKIKWPGGKTAPIFRQDVANLVEIILDGTFLAIDPASRSVGTALFEKGILVNSGTIQLPSRKSINERLKVLYKTLIEGNVVDLLAIEKIRGSHSHVYLQWSIGVAVAGTPATKLLEVPVPWWRSIRPPGYQKTDEGDAILIGLCLVRLAKEIREETLNA